MTRHPRTGRTIRVSPEVTANSRVHGLMAHCAELRKRIDHYVAGCEQYDIWDVRDTIAEINRLVGLIIDYQTTQENAEKGI